MIAYHIDRYNSLHTGQEITLDTRDSNISSCLFDGKVSKHGAAYLNACCASDFCSFMIEYEFELIRQSFFPHNISRYQSFFAFKNIEDIIYWPEFLVSGYKIYEVEFFHDNCKSYDASYLIGGPNFNNDLCWVPSITFDSAFRYWNGEVSLTPKPELLIQPPLTIKAEKRLSIGLT